MPISEGLTKFSQRRSIGGHLGIGVNLHEKNKVRGSLTVEAALILPMFIFVYMALLSLVGWHQNRNQISLFLQESSLEIQVLHMTTENMDVAAIFLFLEGKWRLSNKSNASIEGETFAISLGMDQGEYLQIEMQYRYKVNLLGYLIYIPGSQRWVSKWWCGGNGDALPWESAKQYYVTAKGEVLHLFEDCSALKREIKMVPLSEAEKYDPCALCCKEHVQTEVYVTTYGEVYHSTKTCSALSRKVFVEENDGRRICAFCSKREAEDVH